ncbi:SDR family NAD(P)-dependent oxidoreductase [Microlunatus panaciterrae]
MGFRVWATVRREQDGRALTDEHKGAVTPLLVDLLDHDSVRAASRRVCEAGPLFGLVNNAGVALPGPLEHLPIEAFRRQLEVNLVGQLLVTQTLLPALRTAAAELGDARIVMIGSISGRIAGPMLGAYAASKFGLAGLSESLRAELAPSGIRVLLLEPGAIATPIWERGLAAGNKLQQEFPAEASRYRFQIQAAEQMAERGSRRGLPPDRAAQVIVAALTLPNPRPRQVVGRDAKVAAMLARVLPYRLLYRMTAARR